MSSDVLSSSAGTRTMLGARGRPPPASAVAAVVTLAWRAMLKIKHVPFQLFDVTVTPIMFTA
jgi:ABC-2 type transport system permease protein